MVSFVSFIIVISGCAESRTAAVDASTAEVDATEPGPVSAEEFCRTREAWDCARERARGAPPEQEQICFDSIDARCTGAAWPSGCAPTVVETEACLERLMDGALLEIAVGDIPECQLCS